ncbi:MAG: isopentenyl-diphosphate delta-isomerase, partial [Pseudomonadota bacterium]
MKKATTKRKNDHLKMAAQSQTPHQSLYGQLSYEPLFGSPQLKERDYLFLGKKLKAPLWVSSMTGGGEKSGVINQRLAQVVAEFELGMGLGSCRLLLESKTPKKVWQHFNLRPTLGKERPFYANLGIAQVEKLLEKNELNAIEDMVGRLAADGLIIHINPLQEFLQPEGDRYRRPAIDTIKEFLEKTTLKVMVKEVGQGMGPLSIDALLRLP